MTKMMMMMITSTATVMINEGDWQRVAGCGAGRDHQPDWGDGGVTLAYF